MEFKRQLYIADLFHPEQIINGFDYVEFNSTDALIMVMEKGYYEIKKDTTIQITVNSFIQFQYLKGLNDVKSDFFEKQEIIVIVPTKELLDEIMNKPIPEDFNIIILSLQPYNVGDYWSINSNWIKNHVLGMIHNISADSIATDICSIVDNYNTMNLRFVRLDIDYISLSNIKINELNKSEYWFNYLRNWANENKDINPLVVMSKKRFYRKIFVDDDFTLYLDGKKDKTTWYFPLYDHLEDTGETIETSKLNYLHKYLDLTPQSFYSKFKIYNWNLIDYNQILKMGYFINEIPLIMGLVQRWLYGN